MFVMDCKYKTLVISRLLIFWKVLDMIVGSQAVCTTCMHVLTAAGVFCSSINNS